MVVYVFYLGRWVVGNERKGKGYVNDYELRDQPIGLRAHTDDVYPNFQFCVLVMNERKTKLGT